MRKIRQRSKFICVSFTILMLSISIPYQSALAAMVGTETILEDDRIDDTRNYLKNALEREDVKQALQAQGINPLEAQARIESLSDKEVALIADNMDQLPAGGDTALILLVIIPLIVFITFIITDSLGHTDIFPFVKPNK